jgi:putative transposase
MGRPKAELILSEAEQAQLTSIARSRSMSAALTQRAQIVLACASGEPNNIVAQRFRVTKASVGRWRQRYVQYRLHGLYDEARPGRPRTIEGERVATLIRKTLQKKPKSGATHWSVRRTHQASRGFGLRAGRRPLQLGRPRQ